MSRRIADWWPRCTVCNKLVDRLLIAKKADTDGSRKYRVICHGKQEDYGGVTAEIARSMDKLGRRLPNAFKRKK